MFLCQILLFVGGLTTTIFAINSVCPVRKDRPITGC